MRIYMQAVKDSSSMCSFILKNSDQGYFTDPDQDSSARVYICMLSYALEMLVW